MRRSKHVWLIESKVISQEREACPHKELCSPLPIDHNSENAFKGCDVVPRHGDQRRNDHAKAAAEHLSEKHAKEHEEGALAGCCVVFVGESVISRICCVRIASPASRARKRPQFNALHFDIYSVQRRRPRTKFSVSSTKLCVSSFRFSCC